MVVVRGAARLSQRNRIAVVRSICTCCYYIFASHFDEMRKKNSLKMQIKISPRALNKSKIRRNTQPEFFCVSRLPSRFSCGSPEQAVKQMRRLRFHYFIFVFFRKLFCLAGDLSARNKLSKKKKTRHAIKMSV